jgi:hypothetical protein
MGIRHWSSTGIVAVLTLLVGCSDGTGMRAPLAAADLWDDIRPPYPPITGKNLDRRLAVILDPGHGGSVDRGTRFNVDGIERCEDALVRDIGSRLAGILAEHPRIHMGMTVAAGEPPSDVSGACLGTEAAFLAGPDGSRADLLPPEDGGLERRAGIISAWHEHFLGAGFEAGDIVLLSLHVDHNRPHRQGAHILYPGLVYQQMRPDAVSSSWSSMMMATHLVHGLERTGVLLHTADDGSPAPLFRGYVTLSTGVSPPAPARLAIFRDTPSIPKILVEVANGAHVADRSRIAREEYRERVASGLANGLVSYLERE